jgi:hypothetical protein
VITVTKSARIWLALALVHLGLMASGVAHFSFIQMPVIGVPISYYGDLSGAGSSYGFFSPGVYGQVRAVIDVYDRLGRKTTRSLDAGLNREVDLRLNDIIEQFINEFDDQVKFQRSLAASLAGSIFAHHQDAKKVHVRIEQFTAPSRKDFVAGKVKTWVPAYSAKFIHKVALEKK